MKALKINIPVIAAAAVILFASASYTNAQAKNPTPKNTNRGAYFVDANGDGICDNYATRVKNGTGNKFGAGKGNGLKSGKGNGTGLGKGTGMGNGTGVCDGTGPKGFGRGRK